MQAVTLVHPKLSTSVCSRLHIPPLVDAVCERLAVNAPLTMLDAIQNTPLTAVQQLVSSQAFATAVARALTDAAAGVPALHAHADGLHVRLTDIALRLRFVQTCSTRLLTVDGQRDVGRGVRRVYDLVDGAGGCVYIAEPPSNVPLAALLSRAISAALDLPLVLPLDALFAAANADDLEVGQCGVADRHAC